MSMTLLLELHHTGLSQEDIVLYDLSPSQTLLTEPLVATYLRPHEPARLPYNEAVQQSYMVGQIRQLILSGDLSAHFFLEGTPINGATLIDADAYPVHNGDYLIMVDNLSHPHCFLSLPHGGNHLGKVRVVDMRGNFSQRPTYIQADPSDSIMGSLDHVLAEDFTDITFIYDNGDWKIDMGATEPPLEEPPVEEPPAEESLPTMLVNGDFATGDLSGWTVIPNPGQTILPSVKSFTLADGPAGNINPYENSDDFYLHAGEGFDGTNPYTFIEQVIDVRGKKEVMLSADFCGVGDSNTDIAIELEFIDGNQNVVDYDFTKVLAIAFPQMSIMNGSYIKTDRLGIINEHGEGPFFSDEDLTKPIWECKTSGMSFLVIYNNQYGWMVYNLMGKKLDDLQMGVPIGFDGVDFEARLLVEHEGSTFEGFYYPVGGDFVNLYTNYAIRSHKNDRFDGYNYQTIWYNKNTGRQPIPEWAETVVVRMAIEKIDGDTTGPLDVMVDRIQVQLFENQYVGWDLENSSEGVVDEWENIYVGLLGEGMTSTVLSPEILGDKIYAEFMVISSNSSDESPVSNSSVVLGIFDANYEPVSMRGTLLGDNPYGVGYFTELGTLRTDMIDTPIVDGQPEPYFCVFGLAVDRTTGNVWIGRVMNGDVEWFDGGDPVEGINPSWNMPMLSTYRFAISDVHLDQSARVEMRAGDILEAKAPEGFSGI